MGWWEDWQATYNADWWNQNRLIPGLGSYNAPLNDIWGNVVGYINRTQPDWGTGWQSEYETYRQTHPNIWRFFGGPQGPVAQGEQAIFESVYNAARAAQRLADTSDGGGVGKTPGTRQIEEVLPETPFWELETDPDTGQPYTSLEAWIQDQLQPYVQQYNDLLAGEMPDLGGLNYEYLQEIMAQLANPQLALDEAEAAEARQMGFFDADGNPDVAALRAWKGQQGFEFREGMTEEQERTARRAFGLTEQQNRETARLMAETAFGNSGGMLAKMQDAYDEAARGIADQRAQFEVQLMNQDFAMRLQEQQVYDAMFQRGQVAFDQYLQLKESMTAQALQAWSMQASTVMDQYQTEWQGLLNQAKMIQDAAVLAIGVNGATVDYLTDYFNLSMDVATSDQYIQQLNLLIEQMETELVSGDTTALMGFLTLLVQLITGLV